MKLKFKINYISVYHDNDIGTFYNEKTDLVEAKSFKKAIKKIRENNEDYCQEFKLVSVDKI